MIGARLRCPGASRVRTSIQVAGIALPCSQGGHHTQHAGIASSVPRGRKQSLRRGLAGAQGRGNHRAMQIQERREGAGCTSIGA